MTCGIPHKRGELFVAVTVKEDVVELIKQKLPKEHSKSIFYGPPYPDKYYQTCVEKTYKIMVPLGGMAMAH